MKVFKVLVVLVMLGVSVFFAVTYYKTFLVTEAEDDGVQTVLVEEKKEPAEQEKEPEEQVVEIKVPVFRTTLPRSAQIQTDGKINNVGGYSNEKAVASYKLGSAYYVVIEGESDNCDISCANQNIVVARFDANLTLTDALTLRSTTPEKFLTSAIHDDGLFIVAQSGSAVSVYSVGLDLKVSRLSLNVNAEKAISYYTSSGVLLALFGTSYVYVYSIDSSLRINTELSFSNQGATSPVAVYKSGDFYLLANGDSSAKAFRFSLEGVKEVINLPFINDILPCKTGYILLSCRQKTTLNLYDYSFVLQNEYKFDASDKAKIFSTDNGYLLVTYGNNRQTFSYYLCKHFDVVSFDGVDYEGAEEITDSFYIDGTLYFTALNRNGVNVYKYDCNSHRAEKWLCFKDATSCDTYFTESGSTFVVSTIRCVEEYTQNFGLSDVFIRRVEK